MKVRVSRVLAILSVLAVAGAASGDYHALSAGTAGTAGPTSSDVGGSSDDGSTATDEPEAMSDEAALAEARSILEEAASGRSINYEGSSGRTIGVMIPWTDNEGFQAMYLGVLQQAIKRDVSIITQSANSSPETGANVLASFVTQGVDAIVLDAFDAAAFVPAVNQANEAGIPVVAYDQVPAGGDLLGAYASDNVQVGAGAADLIQRLAEEEGIDPGELNVLELYGALTSAAGVDRHEGFGARAEELGLNIVAELPTEWDPAQANSAILDAFQANPDIDTVFMGSGCALWAGVKSGLNAIGRLVPRGEEGHINVISIDGCPEPVAAINEGLIYGDSSQQLFLIGQNAGALATSAALGESPEGEIVFYPPLLITEENANDPTLWSNIIASE